MPLAQADRQFMYLLPGCIHFQKSPERNFSFICFVSLGLRNSMEHANHFRQAMHSMSRKNAMSQIDQSLMAAALSENFEPIGRTIDGSATIDFDAPALRTLILESPGKPKAFVKPGEQLVVGRDTPSQLCCPLDGMMSRRHFSIDYTEDGPVIRDLDSLNRTFLNYDLVREAVLGEGDKITAGMTVFYVRFVAN
jgi:hypothetical protein